MNAVPPINPSYDATAAYAPAGYATAAEPRRDRTVIGLAAAVAVLLVLVLLVGGLLVLRSGSSNADAKLASASSKTDTAKASAGTSTTQATPAAAADPTTTDAAPTTVIVTPTEGNGNTTGNAPTNNTPPPAPKPTVPPTAPPTTKPASPAPVITSFTTPENIDCHNGNFQTFTASWTTTNATKVTISIDGPGVYKTYGPTGSDSLPFNCSSPHTFLLTAYGQDGKTVSKTITLQPRNVQVPNNGADDQ